MTEIEQHPSLELVVPGIGTVVNLSDPAACATALEDIRELELRFRYVKTELTDALVRASEIEGSKTLHLVGGATAVISSSIGWEYDAEQIEIGLRDAGMPEHRIREVVKEIVSYKVDAKKAQQAASANPTYAKVIEANKRQVEKPAYVTIKRGG